MPETSGTPDTPARQPAQRPKMTSRERGRRNAAIVAARRANLPWKTIADQFGMTVRGVEKVFVMWEASAPQDGIEVDPFGDLLAGLTVGLERLLLEGLTAPSDASRVGALKGYVDTLMLRYYVARDAGLAPSHPAAPKLNDEMQMLFREFAEILRRHDVSEGAMADLLALAQTQMGQWPATTRRTLPKAA